MTLPKQLNKPVTTTFKRQLLASLGLLTVLFGFPGASLAWTSLNSGTGNDLFTIRGTSHNLWAAGSAGILIHSTDGGQSWTAKTICPYKDLWDFTFHGADFWVVGEKGTFLRSSDGGETWTFLD
jgi:photosystem II stability/assembly factor-like uncharacterized protein